MLTRCLVALLGFALAFAILHDAFEVMLLPRRIKSKLRIVRYFFQGSWAFWSAIGRRLRPDDKRSHFLGLYGPLSLVLLLFVWALGLITAFGSLFWALNPSHIRIDDWLNQLYFSGVTFFTLGYGDIAPQTSWIKALSVFEAGTGLGFIAMVIGYLPVIYQLFSRREANVIMLDSVAGSPPNAVALLCRHADGNSLAALDPLFVRWQQWSAELLESHLSYPMLAYYRSQHDNQSWLAALTAMMDASVLVMVGLGGIRTFSASLTFATSRFTLMEMGRVLGVRPLPSGDDRLPSHNFIELKAELAGSELLFVEEDEAEERLRAFRNTYEPFLKGLAHHLVLELPKWVADPDRLDNWASSPRGKTAKRLVEAVDAEPAADLSEREPQ